MESKNLAMGWVEAAAQMLDRTMSVLVSYRYFWTLLAALACGPGFVAAHGAELPGRAAAFVEKYCIDCHDGDMKKGGLDLTALAFEPGEAKVFDTWVKVHDRVRDGEMPPRKKKQPGKRAAKLFLASLSGPMVAADRERRGGEGRAVARRLNRHEYENALRDLFDAPWLQVGRILPEDGEAYRFNKVGEALNISHVQMARYVQAADTAIRQVMAHQAARPETNTVRYFAREQDSFVRRMNHRLAGRATFPVLDSRAQPEILEGKAPLTVGEADPELRDREAMGVVCSSYEPIELRYDQFSAEISGSYQLRFNAYSIWMGPGPKNKWWQSDKTQISEGRNNEPVTVYSEKPPRQQRKLADFDVAPAPSVRRVDTYLLAGETIRVDASRFFRSRPPGGWHNPLATPEGAPGVAFAWMEMTGPIYEDWPARGHRLLFGDLPIEDLPGGGVEVISAAPSADARRHLRRFMGRIHRHPVTDQQMAPILEVIDNALDTGSSFTEAMIAGYTTVLCSPGFLYLKQSPGALDDYALAERLAFFLWNSQPDAALRDLASRGRLRKTRVLKAQTRRLLADARSRRFVEAFCDYWLDLRFANVDSPDETLYPDYYLDDLLLQSAVAETRLFVAELVKENLPARNVVDSDFAMLNARLARHYDLPPVEGVALRRVALPANSPRGGLLAHASVLKVTANGTTTSPVTRGAWVMERIVGKPPPPPPPGVPAIEPDTRGATTIRQQLEKHRADKSCNACHARIDPVGFALENFDVMGGWRDYYRVADDSGPSEVKDWVEGREEEKVETPREYGKNGQPFAFHDGPRIEAGGQWLDGQSFADLRGLKAILLEDERLIARNLVNQLLVYATGAPVQFGDRPHVEAILDNTESSGYRVRSLIEQIVKSELFRRK